MESKVLLFDGEDMKVGETFMRRARQLVNQQRAEWIDESHSAIRFAKDAEIEPEPAPIPAATPAGKNALYALAKKRLRDRKRFLIHSAALLPLLLFIIVLFDSGEDIFAAFLAGCCLTAYIMHAWFFLKDRVKNFRIDDRKQRRERQLAFEMDKLRRMGYPE